MQPHIVVTIILAATLGTSGRKISGRIVGGSDAPDGQYPFLVSLRGPSHFCGGSIINKRWILSAKHCFAKVSAEKVKVVVGTNTLDKGGQMYQTDFIKHNPRDDASLVRVKQDIIFNKKVQPIKLPTSNFTKEDYPATVSGWGRTSFGGNVPNNLQHIDVNVISLKKCERLHGDITMRRICTFTRFGEGFCNADSGGPLTADGVQIGIVSFTKNCAKGYPDVYTRVWAVVDWINNTIRENS